jgi:hypothetical protein
MKQPAKNQFQNQFFVTEVDIYTRDDNGAAWWIMEGGGRCTGRSPTVMDGWF